ncbi:MAG: outer membrane lipoprotein-sorting protein [Candidatus Marinimicrobia bacterium]|jgi:outer membrane lipoprotein-sorting protein|nr:outer membrane lipoprotein-sorting protein [Candidatus Neomarinimicrobiota bacterium]MBT3575931.1 outer membrane lipoprotein-sorting protein [Candidatus Neomarinimicrobiota bacterium]MBT3679372.1 outer membrane lipoprotein-sorting protein [Candidatus Neomarinimicrobiota bacterium]MBT3951159.1 outer membrane lipoprotein-sorting protein [Candidatus Neomarinimicrobiota bacterium]MBT4254161.1 outer membrane lipoprotein-sorting protein [Candidatus Neomarinimicrobiota bacterium]
MKVKLFVLILVGVSILSAQTPTAEEIVDRVTAIMSPENSYSKGSQTIITSSGKERVFEFESWAAEKGKSSMTRYTKPAAIRGQAFLMLNNADDIWSYFPRTKRVRKLASHAKKQKMQGSDFTYEDMGGGDVFQKKFKSTILSEETKDGDLAWKIQMIGIPDKDPPHPKIIMWVRQSDYYPVALDYYDGKDFNTKSLVLSDIQVIESFPTAMTMVMTDNKERSSTTMKTLEITYAWKPTKGFFSERNLKK